MFLFHLSVYYTVYSGSCFFKLTAACRGRRRLRTSVGCGDCVHCDSVNLLQCGRVECTVRPPIEIDEAVCDFPQRLLIASVFRHKSLQPGWLKVSILRRITNLNCFFNRHVVHSMFRYRRVIPSLCSQPVFFSWCVSYSPGPTGTSYWNFFSPSNIMRHVFAA